MQGRFDDGMPTIEHLELGPDRQLDNGMAANSPVRQRRPDVAHVVGDMRKAHGQIQLIRHTRIMQQLLPSVDDRRPQSLEYS
jgi:hypothetical protein